MAGCSLAGRITMGSIMLIAITRWVYSEAPSNLMSIYPKLSAAATLPWLWWRLQATIPMGSLGETAWAPTIATPIKSVATSAKRWTSWRPTRTPGEWPLTNAIIHPTSTTGTATRVDAEKTCGNRIHIHMGQEISSPSIPKGNLQLKLNSMKVILNWVQFLFTSPRIPNSTPWHWEIPIALADISARCQAHWKTGWY